MDNEPPAAVNCEHPQHVIDALTAAGIPVPPRERVDRQGWTTEEAKAILRAQGRGPTLPPVAANHPDRVAADTGYREASLAGHPISQRPTPGDVARVRAALTPTIPDLLEITEDTLRAYVRGEIDSAALSGEARVRLGKISVRAGGSLWPRKTAAILWGLHIERIQVT